VVPTTPPWRVKGAGASVIVASSRLVASVTGLASPHARMARGARSSQQAAELSTQTTSRTDLSTIAASWASQQVSCPAVYVNEAKCKVGLDEHLGCSRLGER
jgi:hypothetical protein